jgi:acyl-CoA thioester hydrolase
MSSLAERFPYTMPLDVRFRDVDALGHVNNAVYLTYFELGRVRYSLELLEMAEIRALPFILAEITVSYRRPAFFGDHLSLGVRIDRIGNKSFAIESEIVRRHPAAQEEQIATSREIMVWYDYAADATAPVPNYFRESVMRRQVPPANSSGKQT